MKPETRIRLDKAQDTLRQAQSLNDAGNASAAIEQAYNASNQITAAYIFETDGRDLPIDDETYYLFSKIIQEPNKHPQYWDRITTDVRVVSVLHEAYEPAFLPETTIKDAQQMISHVLMLYDLGSKLNLTKH